MSNRLVPFEIYNNDGTLTSAPQISYSETGIESSNVDELGLELAGRIETLATAVLNSNRAFQRFNTDIIIDGTNVATYHDINNLYTAQIDKLTDVQLPTDAEIATSGVAYPIVFEFSHLAGSGIIPGNNLLRFFIKDGDSSNIETSIGLRKNTSIARDQVLIISKESSGDDWQTATSMLDPRANLLPGGTFLLQDDLVINVDNIVSDLTGVSVVKGYGYLIETGGTRFGTEILANDVIVALINNPSTATDSEDWLIIRNTNSSLLSTNDILFLNQITRTGTRFDASSNIFVDEANVVIDTNMASGTPSQKALIVQRTTNTQQTIDLFSFAGLQFTELVGGRMTLAISMAENGSSGFLPAFISLDLTFGTHTFTFPITNLDPTSGQITVDIDIPNEDYTSALNVNPTGTITLDFSGVNYIGVMTIQALINTLKGTLHDGIVAIANQSSANVQMQLENDINILRTQIIGDESDFTSILPRISPLREDFDVLPESGDAYFLDSTGSDAFPDVTNMLRVTQDNPLFVVTGTNLFVAVPLATTAPVHQLSSSLGITVLTTDEASTNPNLDLGRSEVVGGVSFGVYRVSGLTASESVTINELASRTVVAWAQDIQDIGIEINRIDHELENPILQVSAEVASYLKNDVTIEQSTSVTFTPTPYNFGLTSDADYGVYMESPATATPIGGITSSNAISGGLADGRGQKLAIINPHNYGNDFVLRADNGSGTEVNLLSVINNQLFAHIFVPSTPGGSVSVSHRPTPQNQVPKDWYTLETSNPQLRATATEQFFVNDLPSSATTMTFRYRDLANGNAGNVVTQSISNVGGATAVSQTYTLGLEDGESMTIVFDWQPSQSRIRVECIPNATNPNFFIFDMQVSLEFTETKTIAPSPATTHDRQLGFYDPTTPLAIAIKPSITRVDSNSATLVLVTQYGEFNLQFPLNTLFGSTDSGHIEVNSDTCNIYDYHKFTPSDVLLLDFEQRAILAYDGFFTQQHSFQDVLELDSQLQVRDANDNIVNVGQELVMKAGTTNNYYRVSLNDAGNDFVFTLIT